MKKPTFQQQMIGGVILMIVCFMIGDAIGSSIVLSLGWVLYGLAFLINPVLPKAWEFLDQEKMKLWLRVAGGACVLFGLMTAFADKV